MRCNGDAEYVPVAPPDERAVRSAEADRVREYGLEDRVELTVGAADDGKDLARGGLLLDGLRQPAGGLSKLCFKPGFRFAPTGQDLSFRWAVNAMRPMSQDHTACHVHPPGRHYTRWVTIRRCRDDDRDAILEIVNDAAEAYRGVIPPDRWHDPYMPAAELDGEIADGVAFWGYEADGALLGVMGIQPVDDVTLIRHAYVAPGRQRSGVGGALLDHLVATATQPLLVGTWAAAEWAIRFYERHGFVLVSPERKAELLRTYWTIPDRQVETSVVLGRPHDG